MVNRDHQTEADSQIARPVQQGSTFWPTLKERGVQLKSHGVQNKFYDISEVFTHSKSAFIKQTS